MKLPYLLLLLLPLAFIACDDEDALTDISSLAAPTDLDLQFVVAQDNSGLVTITPGGRGATTFSVDFGDGSDAVTDVAPGEEVEHTYVRGDYTVTLTGVGLNGATTNYSEELTVDFAAPENLVVTVTGTPGNPLSVDVTATADLETDFAVYFGEDPGADPVIFTEGETVSYAYSTVGDYVIRVVARSGGTQTVEETVAITIADPLVLPVDFEQTDRDYGLAGFGGAEISVIDNPDASGENTTARVGQLLKTNGSEVWAGGVFELGQNLDLTTQQQIDVRVWSPRAGVPILLKIENSTDPNVFVEVTENTTMANAWEVLSFNFSAADPAATYAKIAIFYDFGTAGMGETFYFDEFTQTDGRGTVGLPLTFEEQDVEFTFVDFGGASAEVVDNPQMGSGNNSARVVRFSKNANSEVWGGVFIDASSVLDFSAGETLRMKVWSPTAGAPILLKLEDPNDNQNTFREAQVPVTAAGEWQDLSFDLSGIAGLNNIQRIVIFGNFGNQGTDGDYYFDDLRIE